LEKSIHKRWSWKFTK